MPRYDGSYKKLTEMYHQGIKSITCDRGTEFVNEFQVRLVEDTFGYNFYYVNPYAPHERGSNENDNGLLRESFPKPFNFKNGSQRAVDKAVESLYNRPIKILKWKKPAKKFKLEYARIT